MRTNRVYKSLNRPLTILGVERKLFFCAAVMGAATFNLMGSFLGGILVFAALFVFGQSATKSDPQILRILTQLVQVQVSVLPHEVQSHHGQADSP